MYLLSKQEIEAPSEGELGLPYLYSREDFINGLPEYVYFPTNTEGVQLLEAWYKAPVNADKPITGVLCDWLQDHRDLLLSGAVGPNPAERLEQVIEWFRQHFERGSYAHSD